MKSLCLCLMRLGQNMSGNHLMDCYSSLSVMHKHMSKSVEWKQDIPEFEQCLFYPGIDNILDACRKIANVVSKA